VAAQRVSFSVQFGDDEDATFEEVTGLQAEAKVMEYRNGNSATFSTTRISELSTAGRVTMKNGIFPKDTKFFAWYQETKARESFTRRVVVINLLDESGNPKITWTLNNAWPRNVTGAEFKSDGNEVAVESIEIAYETLEVRSAQ
jgi:phage tail-like protein